jgi:hypothetical protein
LGSFSPFGDNEPGYFSERRIQPVIPHPLSELRADLTMAGVEATPMLINVERVLFAVVLVEDKILEQVCGSVELVQKDMSVLNVG